MAIKPIRVNLAERSYDIIYSDSIGSLRDLNTPNLFALIDARVDQLHGTAFRRVMNKVTFIRIPPGENSKNLTLLEKTANALIRRGANRKSTLIAIGGGVIGDFTGFLAGIFMRGISFVQIPTTLLAMVDSSVGGKTAVNIQAGKNMLGVFHQPTAVYILPTMLKTLPIRELHCGLAESIKTALIADEDLCCWLENHAYNEKKLDLDFLAALSYRCIAIKARIVEEDEKEQSIRALLNFGHTLAHALEALARYQGILHGEAVAIGMRFATLLSRNLGFIDRSVEARVAALFDSYHLPQTLAEFAKKTQRKSLPSPKQIIQAMRADKKNDSSGIRYVLLDAIGRARLPQWVSEQELLASLKEFQTIAK